ncbi:MAG: leucine-rich repeat protein [Candidatus Izemoplasmatales bacterium]
MKKNWMLFVLFISLFSLLGCQEQTKEVAVEFAANNGSTNETIVFSNQSMSAMPDDPTKEGYLFDGWYLDQEFTEPFDMGLLTYDASDFTVYAKWIQNEYTVYFDTNSDSLISPIQVEVNSMVPLPTAPQKMGYTFYGWYQDEALMIPFTDSLMPEDNITLYAKWTDSIFYYNLNFRNEVTITGIIPDSVDEFLDIPSHIDTYPVISLTYEALEGYSNITTLNLPDTLKTVPLGFLHDQVNLLSLKTPFLGVSRYTQESQESYYEYSLGSMFVSKSNQPSIFDDVLVVYQASIPYSLKFLEITDTEIIPTYALSSTQIQTLTLHEGLVEIDEFAFEFSDSITTISIPASVSTIRPGAFANMGSLYYFFVDTNSQYLSTNTVSNMLMNKDQTEIIAYGTGKNNYFAEIPNTVTLIQSLAFYGSNLFSITIPSSVISIDDYAFMDCERLTEVVFEENSQLTSIGDYAFANASIISLTIPSSVTYIKNGAFEGNMSLQTVVFESVSNVYSIGYSAFSRTYSLAEIIIPISVTYLYQSVFYGDSHLVVYIEADTIPVGWSSTWSNSIQPENIHLGYTSE